jgi:hypothetical protein
MVVKLKQQRCSMAAYLPNTLLNLARMGANLTIEGDVYLSTTLLELANVASRSGAHITIAGNYLPTTLEQLANILRNQLTIVVGKT